MSVHNMSVFTKKFKMAHAINDIGEIGLGKEYGGKEVHFGVLWQLRIYCVGNSIRMFMYCLESNDSEWAIDTEINFGVISGNETSLFLKCRRTFKKMGENEHSSWGSYNIIDLEMLKRFAVDRKVEFIYEVNVLKMTGFEKEKLTLRKFDESVEEFSDVVLIVEGMKFYQSKMFLSLQSTYFKSLLLGGFKEAKQSEITLNDINTEHFHSLLELIHGESSISDTNIDGILHLADMYDFPTAIRRCEEFLLKDSKWLTAEKLELAITYNLEKLKSECMSNSKLPEETTSVHTTVETKPTKRVGCFACFRK
ncbi:hypothetical protein GCK72_007305 [Caenorhabditis remanei]|uniref:BTB domain-containing protein n=1 Tax=Caenorhabditis remanei TaxID=31234 RepID=A0A6A5HKZ1_CAERE|nr:hypothetical protein GCK72_007305 [Caenorhabditis remanei]KAF1767346.1 hypothetical protein GCK72_007305 [Caenorhabditis remanei]